MAYDDELATRIRGAVEGERGLTEKRMFGGLAFLIHGNMAVSASSKGGLLLRIDPAQTESLVGGPHVQRFVMRGRAMDGWLRVLFVVGTGGAQASDGPLPKPGDLRAVDVQPEGVTVAWDPVADAEEYSVRVIALEGLCSGGYQTTVTPGHTATFTGLTWDCPYSISVRARDLTGYPWRISDYARVQFSTPLPDVYELPGSPSNLRAERDAAGNLTGFAWDGATAGVSPLGYRGYVEFDVITELSGQFFSTNEATTFFRDDPSWPMDNFDYFRDMAELEPGQTMRVWVTTADRINNESPPSNELILTCCPL